MRLIFLLALLTGAGSAAAACPTDMQAGFGGKTFVGQYTMSTPGGLLFGENVTSVKFSADGTSSVWTSMEYFLGGLSSGATSTYYSTFHSFSRKTCQAQFTVRAQDANGPLLSTGTIAISPGIVSFAFSCVEGCGSVGRGELRPR
jgi:hypothetical protein